MAGAKGTRYHDINFILAEPSDTLRHRLMGMLRSQRAIRQPRVTLGLRLQSHTQSLRQQCDR
jgi:hypothetical protein